MPDEETNQGAVEETNPFGGSDDVTNQTEQESNGATEESTPTAEQIAEWREQAAQYKEMEPEFTKRSQENARLRERDKMWERQAREAHERAQQAAQAADPYAEAELRAHHAQTQADEAGFLAAKKAARQALVDEVRKEMQAADAQAQQATLAQVQLREQAARYGLTEDQIRDAVQKIGNDVSSLVKFAAIENGTYQKTIDEQEAAKEREARLAALHTSGAEGRGRGPGALETPALEVYNPFHAANLGPEAHKEYMARVDPATVPVE